MTHYDIVQVEAGIWSLEENYVNVFLADCHAFGILKAERKEMLLLLREAVAAMLNPKRWDLMVQYGNLKKLTRQQRATFSDLWEVRQDGKGARVLFVRMDPDIVVVAAVHKNASSLSQAVNRGISRWEKFLKTKEK